MGKGDRPRGSIGQRTRQDGSTVYFPRVELPPDPLSGVRRQRSRGSYATKREAQDALILWLGELVQGVAVDPTKMTVAELMQHWLAEDAAHTVKPSTLEDYAATVRVHIVPHLGARRVRDLEPKDISVWRSRVLSTTGGRSTQLALLRLKQALAWAVKLELLSRNVAAGIAPPKAEPAEPIVLTQVETADFVTIAASDFYRPFWRFLIETGLRRGEAMGVRWRDISLPRATLSVRQQLVKSGGKLVIDTVKSKASRRTIEIGGGLVDDLYVHRQRQQKIRAKATKTFWDEEGDLVFCTRNGLPLNPDNLYRNLARIVEDAGLNPAFSMHDCRHTHATHLLLAGMPIAYVSRRLGHARESITTDLYSHLVPGYGDVARGALERALRGEALPRLG